MKPVLAWVLGQGGLLGSHLVRALPTVLPGVERWECPVAGFCWADAAALARQFDQAVAAFAGALQGRQRWLVVWAAGAGVVASSREALQGEAAAWQRLLDLLAASLLAGGRPLPGTVFLASSAGGVFGRGAEQVLTERSSVCPASEYGWHKLRQEEALREWAEQRPAASYVIGRIANLYGPGQKPAKPQGLISYLSRCLLYQRPAHVYVPLDTLRDYIFADDCAEMVLACLGRALLQGAACRIVKLFASEEPASVARVAGALVRLARRPLRIICSPSPLARQQPRKLQFRSVVWPDVRPTRPTPLAVGIGRVHEHQRALFCRGRCLPPGLAASPLRRS